MNDRIMAVDIGNTNIECGLFDGERLVASWRLSSTMPFTGDECWQSTLFFCREAEINPHKLDAVVIASVVPSHTRSFVMMTEKWLHIKPLIISVDACPFIQILYDNPEQVGADRLCNVAAGFHHYGGPLIVVDFGTAVTFDVISTEGAYLGGIIIPGPQTMATGLHSRTSQLPKVSLKFPSDIIGVTTEHGIRSGITWGIVDMIDGLIERINDQLGEATQVVATGGYAQTYASHSHHFTKVHPDLVLEGIRIIYERIKK